MILLEILLGALILGYAVMAIGLFQAAEGYEDQHGFHVLWRNNSPDISDVSCVWA